MVFHHQSPLKLREAGKSPSNSNNHRPAILCFNPSSVKLTQELEKFPHDTSYSVIGHPCQTTPHARQQQHLYAVVREVVVFRLKPVFYHVYAFQLSHRTIQPHVVLPCLPFQRIH